MNCKPWNVIALHIFSPRLILVAILLLQNTSVFADSGHLPQPWRAEAVTQGRDIDYSLDWFLQTFSYRHIAPHPNIVEDGVRGSGGSITAQRLFYDFRWRKDLAFIEEQYGFIIDVQRSEDFDGAYDRQLVGLRANPLENLEFWLQGDVFPDKSLSDIYLSSRYRLSKQSWLHFSWIRPDHFFSDKTRTDDQLVKHPQTFFMQWRQLFNYSENAGAMLLSLNLSPVSEIDSVSDELRVESESIRGAFRYQLDSDDWSAKVDISGEKTERTYALAEEPDEHRPFDRTFFETTLSMQLLNVPYSPTLGVRYLILKEEGFFGRSSNLSGKLDRKEPLAYIEGTYRLSDTQTLMPALYLGISNRNQLFSDEAWPRRDQEDFIGKLAVPWTILVENGSTFTISAAIELPEFGFGGGNIQFHWPM